MAVRGWALFGEWLRNPLRTASLVPSSRDLAAAMVEELPHDARRVIELDSLQPSGRVVEDPEMPLADLFYWGDRKSTEDIAGAIDLGASVVEGTTCEHYAFRQEGADWQVWIQQGDQAVPRKLVIVDRNDPAKPTFSTRLTWVVNPTFTDADFTFVPDANAKKIQLATYQGAGE